MVTHAAVETPSDNVNIFRPGDAYDVSCIPPHAPQAEAAVLGSLVLRPYELARTSLEPSDFYCDQYRLMYQAICRLATNDTPIDVVTLTEELQRADQLLLVGGVGAVVEVLGSVPHAGNLQHYAAQVREAAARRRVVTRASAALRMASQGVAAEQIAAELDAARNALALTDGAAVVRCLAHVPSEPLAWLWPGRIPLGKLTLLAGDPGLGKSFLTLDMAARISTGRGWPEEEGERGSRREEGGSNQSSLLHSESSTFGPADVVLFGAEDDLADTVRPRLDAAGADPKRIVAIEAVRGTAGQRSFSLSSDLPMLDAVLIQRPNVKLVVIDPITAYCSGVDSHKNADVRALLAPLSDLAAKRRVAIVAVTHLNKASGGKAIYRAMGSLAYIAAARVGWLVAKDNDDPTRRLLLPVKNNLAEDAGGLAYRIEEGRLEWETGRIDLDADDALASRSDHSPRGLADAAPNRRHRADEFLEDRLAAGPVPVAEILRDAMEVGVTEKMLKDARRRLGVKTERRADGWLLSLNPDRDSGRDLAGAADLFNDPFEGR